MVNRPAIVIGTFIALAIGSVSVGLISDNDFSPVGNFLAIAGVGIVPAFVLFLGGKYGVDPVRRGVWNGIGAFMFAMASYAALLLYQQPYEMEGSVSIFIALGVAVAFAIVIGLISYMYSRKKCM